jgi:hypothetical protein
VAQHYSPAIGIFKSETVFFPVGIFRLDRIVSLRSQTCHSCRMNLQVGYVEHQQVVFRWNRARTSLSQMCELQMKNANPAIRA